MSCDPPPAALTVVDPGPLSTLQDQGRPGYAAMGVGRSGAADAESARLANRLVANPADAAVIESTLGGLRLRAHRRLLVAVTGAPCPVTVDRRPAAMNGPLRLDADQELGLGTPTRGLRSYVAVRGGVAVPPVLGSRSTDLLAGVGPPVLTAGTPLPVGPAPAALPAVDLAPRGEVGGDPLVLRAVPGPRADWFTPEARAALGREPFRVTPRSNRVGMRLQGPELPRRHAGELPSEGMVPGALQVPPGGEPVLFLADHPITGGYPVIAVVVAADVPRAAQAPPGTRIRFTLRDTAPPGRTPP